MIFFRLETVHALLSTCNLVVIYICSLRNDLYQDFARICSPTEVQCRCAPYSTNRTVDMSPETCEPRTGWSLSLSKNLVELEHHLVATFLTCVEIHCEFAVDIPARDGVDEFSTGGAAGLDGGDRAVQG